MPIAVNEYGGYCGDNACFDRTTTMLYWRLIDNRIES